MLYAIRNVTAGSRGRADVVVISNCEESALDTYAIKRGYDDYHHLVTDINADLWSAEPITWAQCELRDGRGGEWRGDSAKAIIRAACRVQEIKPTGSIYARGFEVAPLTYSSREMILYITGTPGMSMADQEARIFEFFLFRLQRDMDFSLMEITRGATA